MAWSRGELLGRLGKGALFALLALFLVAPRSAWAGCGSHARPSGEPAWRTARLDALLRGDLAAELTTSGDKTPDRPAPPTCSGPSCSNNVPAPLSSGIRLVLDPHRGETLLSSLPPVPPVVSRALRVLDEPLEPAFSTSGVFHPPRSIV